MTDDPPTDDARSPKRLSEEALNALESALRELRQAMASGDFFEAERILKRPALDATVVRDLEACRDRGPLRRVWGPHKLEVPETQPLDGVTTSAERAE